MKIRTPSYRMMIGLLLFGLLSISGLGAQGAEQPIVKVEGGFTTPAADGSSQLVITAEIKQGWHIYSLSQGTGGPVASRIQVDKNDNVHLVGGFLPTALPDAKSEPAFDNMMIETHQGRVTWFAPIQVSGDAATIKIAGRVHAQACNDSNCSPPQDYEFTAELSKDLVPQKGPTGAKATAATPPAEPTPPANSAGKNDTKSDSRLAYRANHAPESDSAAGPSSTPASDPSFQFNNATDLPGSTFGLPSETSQHVQFEAGFTKPGADGAAQLIVTAQIDPGWHIYAITQRPDGPVATKITVPDHPDFKLSGPFQAKDAFERKVADGVVQDEHHNRVTWFAPVKIISKSSKGLAISGSIEYEACNESNCTPPQTVTFIAEMKEDLEPITAAAAIPAMPANVQPAKVAILAPRVKQDQLNWQPFTKLAALNSLLDKDVDLGVVQDYISAQARARLSIFGALLSGFLGGLILNVMPCVLPVIGLKIMSFIEQSGHNRVKALMLNVWYSLGLLSVFFVLASLAVFLNLGWGQLFAKPWFIISLTGLVFAMGLSFMGVWEIPIPGFATRTAESDVANQEGATGAFVKGALTTVLATPCTAPFLGPALVWAAAQPPWLTYAVMLSAGLGMASPYLLIGAFPKLIGFLPKPGKWMETFKHIMGFVLLATVVFFLSTLKAPLVVPTVGMLFALWAACWWVGRVSPFASRNAKAVAWAQAVAFAAIVGVLMYPALDEQIGSLTSIMQQRAGYVNGVEPVSPAAMPAVRTSVGSSMAAARPRAVMIDFTADWCVNCKVFENAVLDRRTVIDAVQQHNVLPLRADTTVAQSCPEVIQLLMALNAGQTQIPVLAIFNPKNPNHPIVFPGPCSQAELLAAINEVAPLDKPGMATTAMQ